MIVHCVMEELWRRRPSPKPPASPLAPAMQTPSQGAAASPCADGVRLPNIPSPSRIGTNADGVRDAKSAPPDCPVEDSYLHHHSKIFLRRREIEAELRRELNMEEPSMQPLLRGGQGRADGASPFGRPPPVPKPRQKATRLPPIPRVDKDELPRRRWGDVETEPSVRTPAEGSAAPPEDRWWRREQEELKARQKRRQEAHSTDQAMPSSPARGRNFSSPSHCPTLAGESPEPMPPHAPSLPVRERPRSWRQPRSATAVSQEPSYADRQRQCSPDHSLQGAHSDVEEPWREQAKESEEPSQAGRQRQSSPDHNAQGAHSDVEEPWRAKAKELEEIARQHRRKQEENARKREASRAEREVAEAAAVRMGQEIERRRLEAEVRNREARQREERRLDEIRREEDLRRQQESEEAKQRRQEQEEWERAIRSKFAEEERQRREAQMKDHEQATERQQRHFEEVHRQRKQHEQRRQEEASREEARRQANAQCWRQAHAEDARAQAEAERFRKRREEMEAAMGQGDPHQHEGRRKDATRKEAEDTRGRRRSRRGEASPDRSLGRSASLPAALAQRRDSEQLGAAKEAALQQLRALRRLPTKEERQKGFKDLQRAWHPDKNPRNEEVATAVFQLLQSERNRIINGRG